MVFFFWNTEEFMSLEKYADHTVQPEKPPALDRALFDAIPDAVYLIDPVTSNILDCNRHAYEDLFLSREQVLHHSVLSLQLDVRGLPAWTEIAEVIRQNRVYRFQGHHRRSDGTILPVEVNTEAISHQGREWFISVARDISKRQGNTANRDDWSVLYDLADGVWDWHVADGSLYFSPNLKRFLGYGSDEMEPVISTWKNNVHPDDLPIVLGALEAHLSGRRSQFQATYRLRNRNGFYLWVEDRGIVTDYLPNGEPARAVGFVHDVTDSKTIEVTLQKEAERDSLTGLFNRRRGMELLVELFNKTARTSLDTETGLSLMVIDLDHFKRINDLYGHLEGDEVLRITGSLILKSLPEDTVVFRWGGEEFLAALPSTTMDEARESAENLRHAFMQQMWQPGINGERVTVSVGIAHYPEEAGQLIELIAVADKAVYLAKRLGRNRVESHL